MNYVFYDQETTGISPEYDQPLQFAAILTDENFVERVRINIRCRLAPHILPSPHAPVVIGVNPDALTDPSENGSAKVCHGICVIISLRAT